MSLKASLRAAKEALARGDARDALQHCKAALTADRGSYDALVYVTVVCVLFVLLRLMMYVPDSGAVERWSGVDASDRRFTRRTHAADTHQPRRHANAPRTNATTADSLTGKAAFVVGEAAQAALAYRKALDVSPHGLPAWKGLLEVCAAADDAPGSAEALERLVRG